MAPVFRPEELPVDPVVQVLPPERLFWRRRRLDGGWRLSAARLDGGRRVGEAGFRLWGQRFFDCRRLDGAWGLGARVLLPEPASLRVSGLWRLGGMRCPEFSVRKVQ